jgi:membrane-associated protease RseP (regulator of RpoE activity)
MPERLEMVSLGRPLIYQLTQTAIWGPVPSDQLLHLHPMARAAWFGLLATALNLFPLAQFDGGHVAYAVFGTRARWITLGTTATVLALTFVSGSWLAWALLVVTALAVAGVSHPPTANDHVPLGNKRTVLAVAALAVLVLCFTAVPVEPIDRLVRVAPVSTRR